MSIAEFQSLPLLLSQADAMRVLGVKHHNTMGAIREAHPELAVQLPGTNRWAYRKVKLAELAGVALETGNR